MSANQSHGKRYEDLIKSAFPGSSDCARSAQSIFDIEAKYDKELSLPTSIKVTGSDTICLASAIKFWESTCDQRWLIASYLQTAASKQFYLLREFILTAEHLATLKGNLTLDEVAEFDTAIKSYRQGCHDECRQWVKDNKHIYSDRSAVRLNPKIDSKCQRRLQCSITIPRLLTVCPSVEYSEYYRDIGIQHLIRSTPRQLRKHNK